MTLTRPQQPDLAEERQAQWEDDPTEGTTAPKPKKQSNRELQDRVAFLEMQIELMRPEQYEKVMEGTRKDAATIRNLRHSIENIGRATTRLHATLKRANGTQEDLEELQRIYQKCWAITDDLSNADPAPITNAPASHDLQTENDQLRAEKVSMLKHIEDQNEHISILTEENQRLRTEKAETDEENQQLREENSQLRADKEEYRERESRSRRLRTNQHISAAHKLVLMHLDDTVSHSQPEPTDAIKINMSQVGQAVGLSRDTVGDKIAELAEWGAIEKTAEKMQIEKKGKKIEVDQVIVALKPGTLQAPDDIRPVKDGEEYSRNHGGKREHCKKCGSTNLKRLHHILCRDCGTEYICSSDEDQMQDTLWIATSSDPTAPITEQAPASNSNPQPSVRQDATPITSAIGEVRCHTDQPSSERQDATRITTIGEARCHTDQSPSVRQDAAPINTTSLSPSLEETFTDEEADFWTRWCAIAGENRLNETAQKHVQSLASEITTTQDLQSLYDFAYNRLKELAQSQNKEAVPPRLGNLVKCLPEWRQTQKRRDQEREEQQQAQEHLPGTGRLTNWTQQRIQGLEPPPLVYKRLEQPAPARKPKGAGGAGGLNRVTLDDLQLKRRNERPQE